MSVLITNWLWFKAYISDSTFHFSISPDSGLNPSRNTYLLVHVTDVMKTDEEEVDNTEEVGQMETDEEDQSSEKET